MTDKPKKLSETARALLTAAAMRNDHLVPFPKLPVAAARQVVRSLLNAGFAEDVPVPINHPGCAWRTGMDGGVLALRATALGIGRVTEGARAPAASNPIGAVTDTSAEKAGTKAGGAALADNPPTDNLSENATQSTEDAQGRQNDPNRELPAPAISHAAEAAETTSTSPVDGRDASMASVGLRRPCWRPGTIAAMATTIALRGWSVPVLLFVPSLDRALACARPPGPQFRGRTRSGAGPGDAAPQRRCPRTSDRRSDGLGAAHSPRHPRRPRQEGYQARGPRARPPGRPTESRREGQLHRLSNCRRAKQ
jgi:hypothetical protein